MKKNNKILTLILGIALLVGVMGISYAFFMYYKTGIYTHTITGGKMNVIYDEETGNNILIENAYPRTDKEALTYSLEFEFTVTGYNESEKNIYYAIEIDHGDDVTGKNRFLDSDMKLSLFENSKLVFENQIFQNLDNQDIHYGYINYGTSVDNPVTNSYMLRIWINDSVFITNTPEAYDTEGKSVYSTSEFENSYANFKVNIKADLTYDDIGYLTYDANGGSFTPSKTSLTTGTVTTQKPVMEGKGFLGWSGTKNGEVEYKAGERYTGDYDVLYAVYGNTRNVMGKFSDTILSHAGSGHSDYQPPEANGNDNYSYDVERLETEWDYSVYTGITQIYFINDTQANIDSRYNAATIKDDLTLNNQGSVKAWLEEGENTYFGQEYTLYIGAEGAIYLSDCVEMFLPFKFLYYIDLANADSSEITNMSYMFAYEVYYDEAINVPQPESNSINDDYKVYQLGLDVTIPINREIVNLSSLNTSRVTDMTEMFSNCTNSTLDVSNFDTKEVLTMENMFMDCSNLTTLDVSNFDTNKVENMSGVFRWCDQLEIDISNFDTSNVISMQGMFQGCELVILGDKLKTSKVENMSYMFTYTNLDNIDFNVLDTSNVTNMCRMFWMLDTTTLDLSNFDTSKVTNMSYMFESCYSLENLNISSFDTSKITSTDRMFYYCSKLKKLDISHFDTSNVTTMEEMFAYCSGLTSVGPGSNYDFNLSSLNTSNVKTMEGMFAGCSNLTIVNLSHLDTSSLRWIGGSDGIFENCNKLKNIDISSFDFSKISIYGYAFYQVPNDAIVYVGTDDDVEKLLSYTGNSRPSAWNYENIIARYSVDS